MGVSDQTREAVVRGDAVSDPTTPLSLNEIDFYFTRAAVGAGVPFGIGEDFAEASRYLAYLGLDPARAALPALHGLGRGQSGTSLTLRTTGDAIHVGSGDGLVLSALYAGPVIADRLSIESGCGMERRLRLDDIDQPLLVLGAVAAASIDAARIALSWPLRNGGRAAVELSGGIATIADPCAGDIASPGPSPIDIVLNGAASEITPERVATRSLADGRSKAVRHGVDVDDEARATVLAFFDKCLAPTTDRSRNAGAGAGLTDND